MMHLSIDQAQTIGETVTCACQTRFDEIANKPEIQLLAAMIYAEANQGLPTNDEREAIAWTAMNRYRYLKYLACFSHYYQANLKKPYLPPQHEALDPQRFSGPLYLDAALPPPPPAPPSLRGRPVDDPVRDRLDLLV